MKSLTMIFVALIFVLAGSARCAPPDRVEAQAPPNHVILKNTRGGAYFIARGLKDEYDRLVSRTKALRSDLEAGRINGADAERQLRELADQLAELRDLIEQKKVLVSPLKIHQTTQTTAFNLGPEQLLVVTADNVQVLGWEGPGVKCVLEKTIIAPDKQSVEDDLAALKLVHHHGLAPEIVGKSEAQRQAEEEKFLTSPEGKKLSEAGRANRKRVLAEIAGAYAKFEEFQGKEIDTVEIAGLTHEEGNSQVTVGVSSRGGESSLGSDWKRHAALTVYVPTCKAVAVRGCLVNLKVEGVHAAVILSRTGSQDRDYDGSFTVRDVHGSLTVDNVPLDRLEGIHGNVRINGALELVNSGTTHENNFRTSYTPPARTLVCRGIDGDFAAYFSRADLKLDSIAGGVDVTNDFGETTFVINTPLADKSHRIISESGSVEVHLAAAAGQKLSILALTQCGKAMTNARQDVLEDKAFTLGADAAGVNHAWRGFESKASADGDYFERMERVSAAVAGRERSPGLDLVSRCGVVKLIFDK